MSATRFDFAWDPAYRVAGLPFGIVPRTAYAEVGPVELYVRFGLWSLRTPLTNVQSTSLTGDYAFVKSAGPPHLSFTDRGITFATNGRAGACLQFRDRVKGIDPTGRITHPGATLTVVDPAAFLEAVGVTPA